MTNLLMDKKVKINPSKLNEYTRRELGLRIWLIIIPTILLAFASIKLEKFFELSVIIVVSAIITGLLFLFKREYAKTFVFTMYPPDELHVVVFHDIVYHLGIDVVG